MNLTPLLYLSCFSFPLTFMMGCWFEGLWTFIPFVLCFGIVPLLEKLIGNHPIFPLIKPVQKNSWESSFFHLLPWTYVVLNILCVLLGAATIAWSHLSLWEIIGLTLSCGTVTLFGLNINHELVHKKPIDGDLFREHFPTFITGLRFCYTGHIPIHHNPLLTSTNQDYISKSRLNQSIYQYIRFSLFPRDHFFFPDEKKLPVVENMMHKRNTNEWYWVVIALFQSFCLFFSFKSALFYVIQGGIGLICATSVFYWQHYGLTRQYKGDGKYEPYTSRFTWDCDNVVSNILWINLPRHAHHHAHQALPYWELKNNPASPQLPQGYVTTILLSLIPPLFFRRMNPYVAKEMAYTHATSKTQNHSEAIHIPEVSVEEALLA
jgi:alkane 1-monooxygenase